MSHFQDTLDYWKLGDDDAALSKELFDDTTFDETNSIRIVPLSEAALPAVLGTMAADPKEKNPSLGIKRPPLRRQTHHQPIKQNE